MLMLEQLAGIDRHLANPLYSRLCVKEKGF